LRAEDVVPESVLDQVKAHLAAGPALEEATITEAEIIRATLMTKSLRKAAIRNKPAFDQAVSEIAAALGGKPMTTSVKTEKSAARKIRDEYKWDGSQIKYLLRATILVNSEADLMGVVRAVSERFEIKGRIKNSFIRPSPAGYADINMVVNMEDGCKRPVNPA